MTSRERVLAAFEHEPTDKVPIYHLGLSSQVASYLLDREAYIGGGMQQWREATTLWKGEEAHKEFLKRSLIDAFESAKALDQDIIRFHYWRLPEKPGRGLMNTLSCTVHQTSTTLLGDLSQVLISSISSKTIHLRRLSL